MKTLYISLLILLIPVISFAQIGLESTQKDANDIYLKLWSDNVLGPSMNLGTDFINANQVDFSGLPDVLKLQSDGDGNVTIGSTVTSGNNLTDARLTVRASDDALMDIRLEGNGMMSTPGSFGIHLDDNGNSSSDAFRIFPSGSSTALFAVVESGSHVMLGDLTLTGNLTAANFPDYVFNSDYQLPRLKELKESILKLGHLPEIPSASEVKENGIALGDMTKRLLKKIEELTLYVIDLQEQLDALK